MQRVTLAHERQAVLVSRPDETKPIVLVLDHGEYVWGKPHPTAGIMPPVGPLALAPHTEGGAMMFAFVDAVHVVAVRIWTDDGGPFADLLMLPMDSCEAVTAAYWPGRGWLVAAANRVGARAQLLREDGTRAWRPDGIEVGIGWRAAAAVTAVVDTPSTVMLFQYATAGERGTTVVAGRFGRGNRAALVPPYECRSIREAPSSCAMMRRPRASPWPACGPRRQRKTRVESSPHV